MALRSWFGFASLSGMKVTWATEQGIKQRQRIREFRAAGLDKWQICAALKLTTQGVDHHLRIIAAEDAAAAAKESA
jgi:hypothetical protein